MWLEITWNLFHVNIELLCYTPASNFCYLVVWLKKLFSFHLV